MSWLLALTQTLDILVTFSDSLTDLLQAWSLCCRVETFYVGLICLALKWLPGVYWYIEQKCCQQAPICINIPACEAGVLIVYPFSLSWYQFKRFWYQSDSFDGIICKFLLLRGCFESPVQLVIQCWLITYGLNDMKAVQHSTISLTDWEGNTFFIPYLVPCSMFFSLVSILKSHALTHHPDEDFLLHLPATLCSLFFNLGSMVVSLTYLNDFALALPCLIFLVNLFAQIKRRKHPSQPVFLPALIATTLPSPSVSLESAFRTLIIATSLVTCQLVINLPFNLIGFKYGQLTIFSNYQANLLICCLVATGLLVLIGDLVGKVDSWSRAILAIINLALIYLAVCSLLMHEEKKSAKFGFVSYKRADNHTVSIKAVLSTPNVNLRPEGQILSGTMSSLMENSSISTFDKSLIKVLKIEDEGSLGQLWEFPNLILILLKMDSLYLPASPFQESIQSDYMVMQVTQPDWLLMPDDQIEVLITATLEDIHTDFECSSGQMCMEGMKGGKFLHGFQYRTHESYWLGALTEKKVDSQPFCSDPKVKICGLNYADSFSLAQSGYTRYFVTEADAKCSKQLVSIVEECDKQKAWTNWLEKRAEFWLGRKAKRFCFDSSCKLEEYHY